ncbi:NAD(P)H-dependent oxidoreductase [Arenibacterium sp. CAU 1754]
MTKRIFVWVAHPKETSLCKAIADSYQSGAVRAGAEVRRMDLASMRFDMEPEGYDKTVPLEPDLIAWQDNIQWADHLMVIHPYWWAAMPAKAKAVIDRALAPGFGFKYHARGIGWDKLLTGRTADAFITSDTPPWLDTLIYRRPARRVMRNQVLGFCGIKTRKQIQFGPVKVSSPAKIQSWLTKAEKLGASAAA